MGFLGFGKTRDLDWDSFRNTERWNCMSKDWHFRSLNWKWCMLSACSTVSENPFLFFKVVFFPYCFHRLTSFSPWLWVKKTPLRQFTVSAVRLQVKRGGYVALFKGNAQIGTCMVGGKGGPNFVRVKNGSFHFQLLSNWATPNRICWKVDIGNIGDLGCFMKDVSSFLKVADDIFTREILGSNRFAWCQAK